MYKIAVNFNIFEYGDDMFVNRCYNFATNNNKFDSLKSTQFLFKMTKKWEMLNKIGVYFNIFELILFYFRCIFNE